METERQSSVNISLLIAVSFCIHIILAAVIIIPDISGRRLLDILTYAADMQNSRNKNERLVRVKVGENINQNLKRKITEDTFISDKDSTASGHLTQGQDASWYSETTDLRLAREGSGKSGTQGERRVAYGSREFILNDLSEMLMYISKPSKNKKSGSGGGGINDIKLPQPNRMSRRNTIFFSNSGLFSLNSVEFNHYAFAKRIVDRIASNWYPPVMANASIGGYAPGSTRIMVIPPQEVKTYFAINEDGDVVKSGVLDSYGNKSLDDSCTDAIKFAKNFGPVPEELKKKMRNGVLVIPFIFGYGI